MFSDSTRSRNEVSAPVITPKELPNKTIDGKTSGRQTNSNEGREETTKETLVIDRDQTPTKTETDLKRQATYTSNSKINENEKAITRKAVSEKESSAQVEQRLPETSEETIITSKKPDEIS